MKILFRPPIQSDHPFIFATYLRNRWFDKGNKTTLKRSTWTALYHKHLEKVLEVPQSTIIACLEEDPDVILGYSLWEEGKAYTYVKLAWRSEGLNLKNRLEKELLK